MKTLIVLLLLVSCSTPQPQRKPAIERLPGEANTPMFYRMYKETLSNCINYVLDNPSNDVMRFAKADDPAIGKVMDGEILKCVDFNMELMFEPK